MRDADVSVPPFRIPPLIKRNTALFALSQSFTGAGMQMAYALGPLMVVGMTGSASLAGVSVGVIALSRFLVAYPVGKVMDAYGRKPGILLGLALAMVGTIMLGTSLELQSVVAVIGGMLVFGMGMNAAQQLRVAATDMFPPSHRAQALGYVALGSLFGLLIGPLLIAVSEDLAGVIGRNPLSLPWLLLPVLILSGIILITFVRPDPKEIGMHLEEYYPGLVLPPRRQTTPRPAFRARRLLQVEPVRFAIIANAAAQGNMAVIMVLTSLMLHHHGHSLSAIGFSHMFHSAGMFAFTIPLGKLADRFGRVQVMLPGLATATGGAALVTVGDAYLPITIGTFLVGIGWAATNVAATALIADRAETQERGRAIGFNDSIAGAIAVLMAVITGPVIAWSALPMAGWMAVAVGLVPLPFVLRLVRRR